MFRLTPIRPKLPRCSFLDNGGLYTAAVTTDGHVFTFGCGKHGRLGTGEEKDSLKPTKLARLENIVKVSCGIWHGAALSRDGNIYMWGYDKALGVQKTSSIEAFRPCLLTGPFSVKVSGVSCGNNFTLLWTTDGEAYSWGNERNGVLGNGDTANQVAPSRIQVLKDENVIFMNAGFAHSGAITNKGIVFMFGKSEDGALGLGEKANKCITTPTKIPGCDDIPFTELSCSVGEHHGHTLFVTSDGRVFSVGDGYKGKLGLGDQVSRKVVSQIPGESFNGECILHVSAGGIHSAAASNTGHVFTWGCGSDGRLGHPEAKGHRYLYRSDVPRIVEWLESAVFSISVSCSYYHTVTLVDSPSDRK